MLYYTTITIIFNFSLLVWSKIDDCKFVQKQNGTASNWRSAKIDCEGNDKKYIGRMWYRTTDRERYFVGISQQKVYNITKQDQNQTKNNR